jgi:lipoprotein signal peptidase
MCDMQTTRGTPLSGPELDQPGSADGRPVLRRGLLIVVAVAVVVLDAVSKALAVAYLSDRPPVRLLPGVLQLTETRNAGAAFGIGTGVTVVFTLIALVVVIIILRSARRLTSKGWAIALGLLLGGALGNLGDRLFRSPGPLRGHVVDWIQLPHWPVFNLADSAIVVGGLLAVLLGMRGVPLDPGRSPEER